MQLAFLLKMFPAADNSKERWMYVAALIAYASILVFGFSHHEIWRDETEPWLIASFSESLSDFFSNMKMGSNPYVWYLILHFLSYISLSPVIIKVAHGTFALASVYLIFRFAPFRYFEKILFAFGYYLVFEYAIISRGYSLTIFFLVLFCALYPKYRLKTWPLGIIIFFLANSTGGFGLIFSVSLLLFVYSVHYFDEFRVGKLSSKAKDIGITVLIVISSLYVAFKSIQPPANSVYSTQWFTDWDIQRFWNVLRRLWAGYFPIPEMDGIQFWNTNLFITQNIESTFSVLLNIVSLLCLFVTLLYFSKRIGVWLFYASGVSGILLLFYTNPSIYFINGSRYNGYLFVIVMIAYWLDSIYPQKNYKTVPVLGMLREKMKVDGFFKPLLVFFLSIQVLAMFIALSKDYKNVFSSTSLAGNYVVKNGLDRFSAAGMIDYAVSPLTAYTRKPIYYPDRDTTSTFPIWTIDKYTTDGNVQFQRLLQYADKRNDTILLLLNFQLNTTMYGNYRFLYQSGFDSSIVNDENIYVYLMAKYDLFKDLQSNEPMTGKRMEQSIEVLHTLIQQNKTGEAQILIDKMIAEGEKGNYRRFHTAKGKILQANNKISEAKSEYMKEVRKGLALEEAWFQLGMIYFQEQNADSAIYAWNTTLNLNPNNIDALGNLGVCYLNFKKDQEKAKEYWIKTIELNPSYLQGYIYLMYLCQSNKDDQCLVGYLKVLQQKGVPLEEIQKRGIEVTQQHIQMLNE